MEKVTFKNLSFPLKVIVVVSWLWVVSLVVTLIDVFVGLPFL